MKFPQLDLYTFWLLTSTFLWFAIAMYVILQKPLKQCRRKLGIVHQLKKKPKVYSTLIKQKQAARKLEKILQDWSDRWDKDFDK
jgi:hypothetical protein